MFLLPWLAAATMGFSKTALPAASILAVVLMAAAFPDSPQFSVGAMLPVLLVGDVIAVVRFGRHTRWEKLVGLFPFVLLGMIPGYLVLTWVEGAAFRALLGWFILALIALEMVRQRMHWDEMADRWWFTAAAGTTAGFGTIVANAGGPMMNLYLLSRNLPKEEFIGTCAWFFFLLNLTKIVPFWRQGMLSPEALRWGAWLAPAAVAGGLLGAWLLPRIAQRWFNALVWVLTAGTAVWLIRA